ncbi:hypothetical protein [Hanstruepera marina]|uniref:hypothetical protein n=1 Tax=Hanstruepera marina TaxID=2873265 RepID=UPI001CA67588|nr:hypothetical protein [Hanstruepera marina]
MLKKIIVFLIFCSTFCGFCQNTKNQKVYEFDYILEYNFYNENTDRAQRNFRLINSKNKNYSALLVDLNKNQFKIMFLDKERLSSESVIDKESFVNAMTINLGSNYRPYSGNHNYKKAILEQLQDTIIDGSKYKFYRYVIKKKKIIETYFAVQEISDFNYLAFSSYYNYKKYNPKIKCPNGVLKLLYYLDEDGNFAEGKGIKLTDFQKVKKFISVDLTD